MNFSKSDAATALQAKFDRDTVASSFTVAAGTDLMCAVADLVALETGEEQSAFYGTLFLTNNHSSKAAHVQVITNPKMAVTESWPEQVAQRLTIPVGESVQLDNIFFARVEGERLEGTFSGFKYSVSTIYQLLETGYPVTDENGNPVVKP